MEMRVNELIRLVNLIQPYHGRMITLDFYCDGTSYTIEKTLRFFSLDDYRYEYCLSYKHESECEWNHIETSDIDDIEIRLSWGYDKLYSVTNIA